MSAATDDGRDVPSYIGRWPDCGCVVFAIVDDGTQPKWVARECAAQMRAGLVLERVTVGWVRDSGMSTCTHHTRKGRLVPEPEQAKVGAESGAKLAQSPARVVHCKRERYDVYVGRPSKWGNPFKVPNGYDVVTDPERILERYEVHVCSRPELMAALPELRGKVLGCWCAPKPCHGDVLLRMANACLVCEQDDPPTHSCPDGTAMRRLA